MRDLRELAEFISWGFLKSEVLNVIMRLVVGIKIQ